MLIKQRNKLFNLKEPKSLKIVYVWGKWLGLFADRNFEKGETVIQFKADVVLNSKASPEAVQIDEHHSFDTKWLTPESFINHSCSPNTKLDVAGYRYVALKNIRKNEEITFNYLTTDWDLGDESFRCFCGSKNCYRHIRGLKYLSKQQRKKLKPQLLPFLLAKLNKSN